VWQLGSSHDLRAGQQLGGRWADGDVGFCCDSSHGLRASHQLGGRWADVGVGCSCDSTHGLQAGQQLGGRRANEDGYDSCLCGSSHDLQVSHTISVDNGRTELSAVGMAAPAACEPAIGLAEDGLARLLNLPLDCYDGLLRSLDTRSLVRFAEGVSPELISMLRPVLGPLWSERHAEILSLLPVQTNDTAFGPKSPPLGAQLDDRACFARAYSALKHRCVRCGGRGAPRRSSLAVARASPGKDADEQRVDTSRYTHLCGWLLPPPAFP